MPPWPVSAKRKNGDQENQIFATAGAAGQPGFGGNRATSADQARQTLFLLLPGRQHCSPLRSFVNPICRTGADLNDVRPRRRSTTNEASAKSTALLAKLADEGILCVTSWLSRLKARLYLLMAQLPETVHEAEVYI